VAGACECGEEPSGSIKRGNFLTSCKPVSFSRGTLLHGVSKYMGYRTVKRRKRSVTPIINVQLRRVGEEMMVVYLKPSRWNLKKDKPLMTLASVRLETE
jgi:hypothetical protein